MTDAKDQTTQADHDALQAHYRRFLDRTGVEVDLARLEATRPPSDDLRLAGLVIRQLRKAAEGKAYRSGIVAKVPEAWGTAHLKK